MKGLIVYASKYGSTRQYAEWLRDDTGFALCEVPRCPADLHGYDVVVIGSSILAGRLRLANWIRQHWPALQGKAVYIMLVNLTADAQELAKVVPQSLPDDIAKQVHVFPVGGRYILQRMSFFDRLMIKTVAKLSKDPKVQEDVLKDKDWVDRENLRDLLAQLRVQAQ